MSRPNTHEMAQRAAVDQRRGLRSQRWDRMKYPHRNAITRGISILHGLGLMWSKHDGIWIRAWNADKKKLERVVMAVVNSDTAEDQLQAAVLAKVVKEFELEHMLEQKQPAGDPMEGFGS